MIELRHLRYFLAVAGERNFTRAAERLNMAQPPLSRQMLQLEAEIGAPLFDRRARPLTLTAAGRLFYEQAIQVTQRMDALKALMERFVAAERRRFVIGFVPSLMYAGLPAMIRGLREAMADVELSLVEMMSLEQIAALKERRIDVGFGRVRFDDPAVRREVLAEERLVAALPAGGRLARDGEPADLSVLAQGTVIVYPREPRPSYADQVLSLFRDHGLRPAAVHEVRELQTAIGLVAAEAGACVVPQSVRQLGRADVVYRELVQQATSPIIMSRRADDMAPELAALALAAEAVYRPARPPAA
jgi:DNA-binding transcriptional LysR family regulator